MSDHAAIVRDILTRHASFPFTNGDARVTALAALDALVADEKEARERWNRSEIHAAGLMTQMSLLVAERDEARRERDSWRTLAEGWKLTDDVERHRD